MSRKRHRKKRRCCSICKPDKKGITARWTDGELERLRRFEQAKSGARDWLET